ncbi:acyl-CoA dehydrogenase family protein [Streptomyces sp. NPDC047085]|uniref:acyl-CoA dehydrogenase family protein n=1 Tax=Streptomyces sp. NPDC047085 TaxID=3155140 RepID=UPI0033D4B749
MSTELRETPAAACDEELVERARTAARTLAANAARTEHDLRPAADSLAVVRRAGLFAMGVPRDAGGAGASLRTQVRVIAELGQGCPSTAWITALSAALKTVCSSVFPEAAREVLFADPDAIMCGSTTPLRALGERTGYGFIVSGRWQAVAGCEDSAWAVLAVPVHAEGQPALYCPALISTRDLSVERDRPVTGMAGTGSHTLVAQDVAVPPAYVVFPTAEADRAPGFPAASTALLGIAVVMLAPLLGAARGAQHAMEKVSAGVDALTSAVHHPPSRPWLTTACRLLDSATSRVLRVADALDDRLHQLHAPANSVFRPAREHARMRAEMASAAQECREAVDWLLDPHSLGGFAPGASLRRIWRDLAVIMRHPQFGPHTVAEDYGRVLFGPGTAAVPMP